LLKYRALVTEISCCCNDILMRYSDQVVCAKGCKGNCCRIHLSIPAVEAFHLGAALMSYPADRVRQIRARVGRMNTSGPCPLLDRAACTMYPHRLILCRTHGLPIQNRYRGKTYVGCCQKNFQQLFPIPRDARLDLDRINRQLARINRQFMIEYGDRHLIKERYSIGEALMLRI